MPSTPPPASLSKRVPASVTHRTLLVGAPGYFGMWNQREGTRARAAGCTVHPDRASAAAATERASASCWRSASEIAAGALPAADRRRPHAYLMAEARYAASHEGALHLDDVLTRRTRISIETFDREAVRGRARRGRSADGRGAGLGRNAPGPAGDRSTTRRASRPSARAQEQPDDLTADATRLGAAGRSNSGPTRASPRDVVRLK